MNNLSTFCVTNVGEVIRLIFEGDYGIGVMKLAQILKAALPGDMVVDANPGYPLANFSNEPSQLVTCYVQPDWLDLETAVEADDMGIWLVEI
jgi:hypothetical protein